MVPPLTSTPLCKIGHGPLLPPRGRKSFAQGYHVRYGVAVQLQETGGNLRTRRNCGLQPKVPMCLVAIYHINNMTKMKRT